MILPRVLSLSMTLTKNVANQLNENICVHKVFDKSSGGYITGQEFIVLLLVTAQVTIPVGESILSARSGPNLVKKNKIKN